MLLVREGGRSTDPTPLRPLRRPRRTEILCAGAGSLDYGCRVLLPQASRFVMDVSRRLQQCPPCLVSGFRRGDAVPGLWYQRFLLGIVELQSLKACYIRMLRRVDPVAKVFVPAYGVQ